MTRTSTRSRQRPPRYALDQFAAVRRLAGMAWSHDSRRLLSINTVSGQFNIWSHEPGSPDRWPSQLTAFTDHRVWAIAPHPANGDIYFTADRHGDEYYQLYRIPADTRWPVQLTDLPKVQVHLTGPWSFSPDGRHLAISANDREPTDSDIILRDLRTGEHRRLTETPGFHFAALWHPSGRHLIYLRANSNTDHSAFLVNVRTGKSREINPRQAEEQFEPVAFAPGGDRLYVRTNRGRQYLGLALFDPESNELEWVAAPRWDISAAALSADGRKLAYAVNEAGVDRVRLLDARTGRRRYSPRTPPGAIADLRFSPDGRWLGYILNTSTTGGNLHSLRLRDRRAAQLTQALYGNVAPRDLVTPEAAQYPTFDGRGVPALLYRPRGASKAAPAGAVLSIHGGPESQERPIYNPLYQYLLSRGIAVLAPNIRGSTGYGVAYQRLIHRDWGGGELKDLEHAAKFLRSLDWIDGQRLGVFGGSFGGFATLSAVTRLPKYWAAAVDIVGPSNLVTFAKAVPPTWRRFMKEWVGDPDEDRDFLLERSPITYVDNVRAPLLVIQGANDPRVVKPESDQMVERLRALGRKVEYLVFEDEGHGFTKEANQRRWLQATAEWFVLHLAGD